MKVDGPEVLDVTRRAMVARLATLSRNGRPSINPLYFVCRDNNIWLGTDDWTLAARNARADRRVSVLFEVEKDQADVRVLQLKGYASISTDPKLLRSYNFWVAWKYILTPPGIRNALAHIRQIPLKLTYNAQSAKKGCPCVIMVIPEHAEFV